jgi:hypothetical protein
VPLADRTRRDSAVIAAPFQIVRDSGVARKPRPVSDRKVIGDPYSAAEDHEIA